MDVNLRKRQPALLILDLQALFTSAEGRFENTGAGDMIEKVKHFVSVCTILKIPVIYSRYLLRDDLSDAGLLAGHPVMLEGHFCESSDWMKLDSRLKMPESAIHLQRNRPGAFWRVSWSRH